jgi:endoglucanase
VTKAAIERGILPMYWDNGGTNDGGESFALFERASGKVLHQDLLDAMQRALNGSTKLSDIALPKTAK